MKKCLVLLSLIAVLVTGCGKQGGDIVMPDENSFEILRDTKFETGFDLMTPDTNNGRTLSKVIDYNGKAKKVEGKRPWQMAQWWTPFDFKDALYSFDKSKHIYQNQSRRLEVNTTSGELTMELNSKEEYFHKLGHSRKGDENWSHFLIEQDIENAPRLIDLDHVFVNLEFSINQSLDLDVGQAVPCAQITWYFTIADVKNGDSSYQSGNNDYFWFGLPLFDSRFDFVEPYKHVDSGFVGATNKLIYSTGSKILLNEKIQLGKIYTVSLDILPLIKQAYLYGYSNGAMAKSKWADLVLNYMNLGWELPGSFLASTTIKNISIKIQRKDESK